MLGSSLSQFLAYFDVVVQYLENYKSLFWAIGATFIFQIFYGLINGIYARLLRPGKSLVKLGKWAVVTGATDGIGKAMADEMARKGLSLLIISRTKEKLSETEKEITSKYPKIEVRTLDVDYSKFDEIQRTRVGVELEKCAVDGGISVLVNNVGISYPFTRYFHELDNDTVSKLMSMNVDATTWMTRLALPHMLEKKKGCIVNISSAAGVSTSPLLAQYGAAKSYVAMFSRALNYELREKGVHVQCQVPMFVATKLAKLKKTSTFVASPEAYAKAAVASIGYEVLVSPYWSHALQIWVLTSLPEFLIAWIVRDYIHKPIMKAGMKKEAREALAKEKSN
jgi:17beta-estradiol 17-dehydrogenase / very-long-chain 3-oxoacyl-CoA reductase